MVSELKVSEELPITRRKPQIALDVCPKLSAVFLTAVRFGVSGHSGSYLKIFFPEPLRPAS